MEGLGYLPTATNVAACAYIRDLRFRIMAYNLLRKPLSVGNMKLKLDNVAEWTGVPLREMDHVLLGAVLRGGGEADLMPPVTLVVRTVLEHDQEKVRKAMKATQPVSVAGADGVKRTLYAAKLGPLPVRLFQPDKQTVVIGLFDDEMSRVPGKPHEGAKRLPAEVRGALEARLPGAPGLWAVGHSEDWTKTWAPTLLKGLPGAGPLAGELASARTVAVGVTDWGREGGHLLWQVKAADAKAAQDIEQKVLAPRLKANPNAFTYARDGAWIKVELKIDTGPPPGPGSPLWGS
jgi:hypothetical protein